ncbi:MAG: hypothetical protein A2Y10_20250 [Planctomycetes bacterium GWF2_41_51]|nr:MAG: hypothetical protein A2Y10_20250 [Planctomycetes bacterium GWF2_41_51]HBG25753.1 hypothetical protein [Phycisphaerales bacterium]
MSLANSLRLRLDLEINLIKEQFGSDFELIFDQYSDPYFTGWVTTSYGGNQYKLTLNLDQSYPDTKPELYITHPKLLRKYDGGYINDEGTSHAFHTWENSSDGCIQICHTDNWDASATCLGVLLRGLMWLEFYDAYRRNGGDIDQYC